MYYGIKHCLLLRETHLSYDWNAVEMQATTITYITCVAFSYDANCDSMQSKRVKHNQTKNTGIISYNVYVIHFSHNNNT